MCVLRQGDPAIIRTQSVSCRPLSSRSTTKGYDLYVDRFYSSPLLTTELSKVGVTVTGSIQSNRKGLPKDITMKRKNEPRGTIRAARSGDMIIVSWQDKRKVLIRSTMLLQCKLEQGIHINITHTHAHVVTIIRKYTIFIYYTILQITITYI